VGLIVVALPFARQFTTTFDLAQAMALVIAFYALGLVPFSLLFLVQRVFYALEDTRTPFFLQVFQAVIFVTLALVSATLPVSHIAMGLALSATLATTAQTVLALLVLRRKLGGLGLRGLGLSFARYGLSAVPASAAGSGVLIAFGGLDATGLALSSAVIAGFVMAMITIVMVAVYLATLLLLRDSQAQGLMNTMLLRLRLRTKRNTSS
jgi:putative peptidoglycan lipid II flippase